MNVDNKMESIFRALGDYYRGHKAQTHWHSGTGGGIDSAHGSVIHAPNLFSSQTICCDIFLPFQFSLVLLLF